MFYLLSTSYNVSGFPPSYHCGLWLPLSCHIISNELYGLDYIMAMDGLVVERTARWYGDNRMIETVAEKECGGEEEGATGRKKQWERVS